MRLRVNSRQVFPKDARQSDIGNTSRKKAAEQSPAQLIYPSFRRADSQRGHQLTHTPRIFECRNSDLYAYVVIEGAHQGMLGADNRPAVSLSGPGRRLRAHTSITAYIGLALREPGRSAVVVEYASYDRIQRSRARFVYSGDKPRCEEPVLGDTFY